MAPVAKNDCKVCGWTMCKSCGGTANCKLCGGKTVKIPVNCPCRGKPKADPACKVCKGKPAPMPKFCKCQNTGACQDCKGTGNGNAGKPTYKMKDCSACGASSKCKSCGGTANCKLCGGKTVKIPANCPCRGKPKADPACKVCKGNPVPMPELCSSCKNTGACQACKGSGNSQS